MTKKIDLYLLDKIEKVHRARCKMDFSLVCYYHLAYDLEKLSNYIGIKYETNERVKM